MLRHILVVIAAFVAGNVLIFAVQGLSHLVYPLPEGLDFNDPEAVKSMVASMPLGAFLGVELSYAAASAGAGAVIGKLATSSHTLLAAIVGTLFTLANVANLMAIPHPIWFAVLTMVTFLPITLAVARALAPKPATS